MQKNWVSVALLGLCLFLIGFSLVGCRSDNKLSDAFDRGQVEDAAAAVVELVNNNAGEALRAMSIEAVKQAFTDEVLAQVFEAIDALGDFEEITETEISSIQGPTKNSEIAVAIVTAKYAEGTATYTISFDTDMSLAGLYYR